MVKRKMALALIALGVISIVVIAPVNVRATEEKVAWPERDIELIVPMKPGAGYDIVARITAPFIERYLPKRVNVVVKNQPGAGGKIGFMALARAKSDGHTIGLLNPLDVTILQVKGHLEGLDARKLSWLARLDILECVLVVGTRLGFKSPSDMAGKTIRFGAPSFTVAFQSAALARKIGATAQIVSYDGMAEAHLAARRGDVDAIVVMWGVAMRQIRASEGKLAPLFLCSTKRVPEAKEVPTAFEVGLKLEDNLLAMLNFTHVLTAPRNLPPERRKMWEKTLFMVMEDQNWRAQMSKAEIPASPLLGEEKLDSLIVATLKGTEEQREILATLK